MRWMVLGGAGQLGQVLLGRLGARGIRGTRAEADLCDPDSLRQFLDRIAPDGVINCAAYNLVDRAEDEPEKAFAVNAWGVRNLAGLCGARRIPLVHISTDHVFGRSPEGWTGTDVGHFPAPWLENDLPNPLSAYGLSKLTGEGWARMQDAPVWVIRTCGLYGHHGVGGKGTNFVETMLRLAREGREIRVVSDQWCTPTPVEDLAESLLAIVESSAPGLYHLTSGGFCSWNMFAQAIFEELGMSVKVHPISSAQFGAKARRPNWSVLGTLHQKKVGVPEMPEWRQGLARYLKERCRIG